MCVLIGGLSLRAHTLKRHGLTTLTVTREVAEMVSPETMAALSTRLEKGAKIMVAARGVTPVLNFALEEARAPQSDPLCALRSRNRSLFRRRPGNRRSQRNGRTIRPPRAIMSSMMKEGEKRGLCRLPVYAVSGDAAATHSRSFRRPWAWIISSLARRSAARLPICWAGASSPKVAAQLPDTIRLLIFG